MVVFRRACGLAVCRRGIAYPSGGTSDAAASRASPLRAACRRASEVRHAAALPAVVRAEAFVFVVKQVVYPSFYGQVSAEYRADFENALD